MKIELIIIGIFLILWIIPMIIEYYEDECDLRSGDPNKINHVEWKRRMRSHL